MTNINLPPLTGEQDEDQWKTQVTNWANSGNLGVQGSNIDGDAVTYEDNGEIRAGDILLGYQLRYLDTAYATNANGSDNFSDQIADLPGDATVIYQGRRNSATPNKSNTPAAFTWVLINPVTDGDTPGDGLGAYYRTAGGRFLDWIFDTTQPTGYTLDDGASVIDLELFEGTPGPRGEQGVSGDDGSSVAVVNVFLRSASQPADPVGGSYNFTTNVLDAPSGWQASVPEGTDPLYTSQATASVQGSTGIDSDLFWTTAMIISENGTDGTDGSNGTDGVGGVSTYAVLVFRRFTSVPPIPNGGSYNFGTSTFTPPNNWQTNAPTGTDPIYASTAYASAIGGGTDADLTWTSPVLFVQNGADGADAIDGTDGNTSAQVSVFLRAALSPEQPTGGSYNFTTNVLTPPTSWFTSVPAGSEPAYSVSSIASIVGNTGTDSNITWSSPVLLVANGADGVNGTDGTDGAQGRYTVQLFKRAATIPDTPTDVTWTEATDSLSGDNSDAWSLEIPDGTDQLYITEGIYNPVTNITGTLTSWSEVFSSGVQGPKGDTGDTGASGLSGMSLYEANVFLRSELAPSTPVGGSYNFTTNILTPPNAWNVDVPSGTIPVFRSTALASIEGATGVDSNLIWSGPVKVFEDGSDGTDGADGSAGLSTFQSQIFIRATTLPATPTGGEFNFGTNILTPPTGWAGEVPAGTDPIYATTGLFSIVGDTGTDNTVVWVTPTMFVQNGADGTDGTNGSDGDPGSDGLNGRSYFEANIYLRATATPTQPTGGSYDFDTETLTPPTSWFIDVPTGTDPVYRATGLFSVDGATGIDTDVTWSVPVLFVQDGTNGTDGSDGNDGRSTFQAIIFQRSVSVPDTPAEDDGSFDFDNQILVPPSGWSITTPITGTNPVYTSTGLFSIVGDTGTDETVVWTAPALAFMNGNDGSDGNDGTDGSSSGTVLIYRRLTSTPATPADTVITVADLSFTAPDGWSKGIPAGTAQVWLASATFNTPASTATLSWTEPEIVFQDGQDGSNGTNTAPLYAYKRSASTLADDNRPTTDVTYTFSTATVSNNDLGNGWSFDLPAGTDPLYTSVGVISSTTDTASIVAASFWSSPQILGDTGNRGAGAWNHRVGTTLAVSYTQAQLNAFLAEAIPGANNDAPINGDQLFLFSSVSITDLDVIDQAVYLFSGSAWIGQSITINGKLIANGSIDTTKLVADGVVANTVRSTNYVAPTLTDNPPNRGYSLEHVEGIGFFEEIRADVTGTLTAPSQTPSKGVYNYTTSAVTTEYISVASGDTWDDFVSTINGVDYTFKGKISEPVYALPLPENLAVSSFSDLNRSWPGTTIQSLLAEYEWYSNVSEISSKSPIYSYRLGAYWFGYDSNNNMLGPIDIRLNSFNEAELTFNQSISDTRSLNILTQIDTSDFIESLSTFSYGVYVADKIPAVAKLHFGVISVHDINSQNSLRPGLTSPMSFTAGIRANSSIIITVQTDDGTTETIPITQLNTG